MKIERGLNVVAPQPHGVGGTPESHNKTLSDGSGFCPRLQLAQKDGQYEPSISLEAIGISANEGVGTRGDIGVLTGDGTDTTGRYYWNNRIASLVSDIPTKARLVPDVWGVWKFT